MLLRNSILAIALLLGESIFAQTDSLLSFERFMEQVMEHHPRVYQAVLKQEAGEATVLRAKGGFDPTLDGNIEQKYFQGSSYYSYMNAGLRVPTWFGISASAGYDNNSGLYLNPSDRLPENGLWYAGLQLELGNGLLLDKRRAELQKARLYQAANEAEASLIRNQLRYDAAQAYWDWAKAYGEFLIYEEALKNAQFRKQGVVEAALFGDRPSIDTLEATIQYGTRLLEYQRTSLELVNKRQKMEIFLWLEGAIPLEADASRPELPSLALQNRDLDIIELVTLHPYLDYVEAGVERQRVELRYMKEGLKPKISLKYRAINAHSNADFFESYSPNNYTWGAAVSYAIPARQARGDVKLANALLQDQVIGVREVQRKLGMEIQIALNELLALEEQLEVAAYNSRNYEQLFLAEQVLFENGESTLFMINSRELAFLDAQNKLLSMQWKWRSCIAKLNFASAQNE